MYKKRFVQAIKIFQNENNSFVTSLGTLRPDCSSINLAETSTKPEDWLLHPTGITFRFDAKLKSKTNKA